MLYLWIGVHLPQKYTTFRLVNSPAGFCDYYSKSHETVRALYLRDLVLKLFEILLGITMTVIVYHNHPQQPLQPHLLLRQSPTLNCRKKKEFPFSLDSPSFFEKLQNPSLHHP